MKKIIPVIIAFMLAFTVHAADDAIKVTVNGQEIQADAIIMNGRTMVPLRAISEALGSDTQWYDDGGIITSRLDNTLVVASIGSNVMTVNGETVEIDSPPIIVNNKTMVPIRAIAEGFGASIEWDNTTKTVSVSVKQENPVKQDTTDKIRLSVAGENITLLPDNYIKYMTDSFTNQDISKYEKGSSVQKPVMLTWSAKGIADISSVVLRYATDEGFKNQISLKLRSCTSYSITNLYTGKTYFWKVEYPLKDGSVLCSETGKFSTSPLTPRLIYVDGINNVRDLGGWKTSDSRAVRQGMIYRGGEMNGPHGIAITKDGIKTMTEELKIISDVDLRSPADSNNITKSPLGPKIDFNYFTIKPYTSAFNGDDTWRRLYSYMANPKHYPMYVHCWGGADRAGTVSFMISGLLGVSYEDCVRDYELTSLAPSGLRTRYDTENYHFESMVKQLNKDYQGDSLQQKIESYMLSIGVTKQEIASIKAILKE